MNPDGGELVGALLLSIVTGLVALVLCRGLERLLVSPDETKRHRSRLGVWLDLNFAAVRALVWILATLAVIAILLGVESKTTAYIGIFPLILGLGLALRDPLVDAVAGVRLVLDRPFQCGDRISVAGDEGTVLSTGLTRVRIQIDDGWDLYLPNSRLAAEGFKVSKGAQREIAVEVLLPVPSGMAIVDAKGAAYRAAAVSRFGSTSRKPQVYLESADDAVVLRVKGFVSSPNLRDAYRSDLLEIWLERSVADAF